MLTKTHSIVTVDPFYNVFTFNFSYHSKSHSMTIMNIWTFEKVVEYNINQTVTSKKSAYFGDMDPFLNVDTLYLTCIYSTFLFFSSCPEYLCTQKEKVHSPLSQLVCCYEKTVTYLQPVPLSIQYLSTWELYNHQLQENDCPVIMWPSRIRKQQHIEQIIGSCKLECRI